VLNSSPIFSIVIRPCRSAITFIKC